MPITWGDAPVSLTTDGDEVVAELDDGSADHYDLVLGADGVHSSVRRLAFARLRPAPRGPARAPLRPRRRRTRRPDLVGAAGPGYVVPDDPDRRRSGLLLLRRSHPLRRSRCGSCCPGTPSRCPACSTASTSSAGDSPCRRAPSRRSTLETLVTRPRPAHRRRGARHLPQHGRGRGDGPRGRGRAGREPGRRPGPRRRDHSLPEPTPTPHRPGSENRRIAATGPAGCRRWCATGCSRGSGGASSWATTSHCASPPEAVAGGFEARWRCTSTTEGRRTSPCGRTPRSRPRVTSTGLVRQRTEPPPRWNSETSTTTTSKPHSSSRARTRSGQAGHHDGRADDHGVGAERRQRLLLGEHQRLGHQVEQRGRRGRVQRVGADQRAAVVERAEGQVEVVHPGVGDPQPADPDAQVGGEVLQRELLGARAVADDQVAAERERVAGLEVGTDAVAADVRRGPAALGEPRAAVGVSIRRWG